VSWLQYGGPAKVTFEGSGPVVVETGQATTRATFPVAGKYRLVAIATDPGRLATRTFVDVTVTGAARSSSGQ
jgi:hypothetical protein